MRVLFVDQYGYLGGAQQCLLDLLPALADRDWRALLAAPNRGPLLARAAKAGAATAPLPLGDFSSDRKPFSEWPRFVKESLAARAAMDRLIMDFQPDLIHANGPRVLPAAAFASRRRGVPLLYHCHHRLTQRTAIRSVRAALRHARASVVSCCRFAAEPLAGAIPAERMHVVYNGVRGPSVLPAVRASGRFRAGVIGRIAPEKGQIEFLRAARIVHQGGCSCEFIICGDTLLRDAEAERYTQQVRFEAEGLPVEFLGWRDDALDVIRRLDLVVVPSPREPATTRVILEAYACGVPVLAFASGGIPEVVRDRETGVLVEPRTPEALAKGIRSLVADEGWRVELGENGRAEWERGFTVGRYQQDILRRMAAAAPQALGKP